MLYIDTFLLESVFALFWELALSLCINIHR